MKIGRHLRRFGKSLNKKKPEILMAFAISGYFTSIGLAVVETPKAVQLIDGVRDEDGNVTKKDAVKASWKCYIPAALTAAGSTACAIASCTISHKRNVALATAYAAAMASAQEYKNTVLEVVGEEKAAEIRKVADKKKMDSNPITQNEVLKTKGNGLDQVYDPWSGRYFWSSIDEMRMVMNDLNYAMLNYDTVRLNDFYDMLGLDHTKPGLDYGWDINNTGPVKVMCSTQIADNNRPCFVLGFDHEPRFGV